MISSVGPSFWPTCCFSDWISPGVSCVWQCQHHWVAGTEHFILSGQCTFRCSLQHHSVSSEWCWAKHEQPSVQLGETWFNQHTVSQYSSLLNLLWFLIQDCLSYSYQHCFPTLSSCSIITLCRFSGNSKWVSFAREVYYKLFIHC